MRRKTNYIVVFYLGNRRTSNVSKPVALLHKHLLLLQSKQVPVDRVTVVINTDLNTDLEPIMKAFKTYDNYYTELKICLRQNVGFSYGGWSDVINSNLEDGLGFTHYFLIEDDYLPVGARFLKVFHSKMLEGVGYVCQKVFYNQHNVEKHAAISNGLLLGTAAQAAYDRFGTALNVLPATSYGLAEWNQIHFLENLQAVDYDIVDISDISSVPFIAKEGDHYTIIEHGSRMHPHTIEPIVV